MAKLILSYNTNMKNSKYYQQHLKKPTWAPPSWLFAPVWTILYILIAISFGYIVYLFTQGEISFIILLPFILNFIFNVLYTPIQFGLKNNALASVDIILVLGTLIWSLFTIYHTASWVSYINIPYLAWVSFATVLQFTITAINRKSTI